MSLRLDHPGLHSECQPSLNYAVRSSFKRREKKEKKRRKCVALAAEVWPPGEAGSWLTCGDDSLLRSHKAEGLVCSPGCYPSCSGGSFHPANLHHSSYLFMARS